MLRLDPLPLPDEQLALIRARAAAVHDRFNGPPSETQEQSRQLFVDIVKLLRDDVPQLLGEITRLRAELQLAVDLLNLEA